MPTEPDSQIPATLRPTLERSVVAALETYANVHRGSGHQSAASTHLYEEARGLVLDHLGLPRDRYTVVFGTPRGTARLEASLAPSRVHVLSSDDVGLPLGLRALAIERRTLPTGAPAQPGGGTARLVGPDWVVWAHAPDRFEAGTPAIVNVVALAAALRLSRGGGAEGDQTASTDAPEATRFVNRTDLEPYRGSALLRELRKTLIGRDALVPVLDGVHRVVHLDNAASTPTFEPVWEAVRQAWQMGPDARRGLVREVRTIVADVMGAPDDQYDIVFTQNTTEAINLVAESLGRPQPSGVEPVVVNTLLEHNSNELPWRTIACARLVRARTDLDGFVDLDDLESCLRRYNEQHLHGARRVVLVAVTGASNVLGAVNDIARVAAIAHRYGARVLIDGAQLLAHRAVDVAASGIDYFVCSGHKVYAPFGTGVLVARNGLLAFSPEEEREIRASGETNVGGIAALGTALRLLQRIGMDVVQAEEQALTARLLTGLSGMPGVTVHGMTDPASNQFDRKVGVVAFDVKGMIPHSVGRLLAAVGGIAVRSGCHCAHLGVKHMLKVPSWAERLQRVIVSLAPRLELPGVVRVSLGLGNTEADVDHLLQTLERIQRDRPGGAARKAAAREMERFCRTASARVYHSR